MKKYSLLSALVLLTGLSAFAQETAYNKKWYADESIPGRVITQNLYFDIHGRYSFPVKKEKLDDARLLSDFIPGYPVNWISDYVSVEISTTNNGKSLKAVSTNDVLNPEQKNILRTADLGTEITINVKDKYKNPVTDIIYDRGINISMMLIPEVEAEYIGGFEKLKIYLKKNIIDKITETTPPQFQAGNVTFTVNEEGKIITPKISKSSGDPKTDEFLIEEISKMPKWRPARNSKGVKVKQEFVFSMGSYGC